MEVLKTCCQVRGLVGEPSDIDFGIVCREKMRLGGTAREHDKAWSNDWSSAVSVMRWEEDWIELATVGKAQMPAIRAH